MIDPNLSAYEVVLQAFKLPLEPYPFQLKAINDLSPLSRSGWYAEVGCGKTLMCTIASLYRKLVYKNRTLVLVPPILITQWYRWLKKIPGVTVARYRGSPDERKRVSLDTDFVLMSIQVFKNDFEYLLEMYEHFPVTVLVDEATAIKNPGSQNHKRVRDFAEGRDLMLLTATPLSTPGDAYAYVKLVAPTIYRNQRHFESLHVEERDSFDNVQKWANLEFLSENMKVNSVRILKEEALPWIKQPIYVPTPYELDPEHMALYIKLADEQLLLLEDGGKIDATSASKLYNALQQIVCNPAHFTGDPSERSAAYDMLDAVVDEVGLGRIPGAKLLVVGNYRMTNRALIEYLQPFGAVGIYGEVSQAQQGRNLERFLTDPTCGAMVIQPMSGGKGLDGLQEICSDAVFMELPIVPYHFTQAVGRLYRDGQKKPPTIRIPFAERTIQVRLQSNMLDKDALVNRVVGGFMDLREAIYGGP
jgi:SNF2 family DNA or RNA helicase